VGREGRLGLELGSGSSDRYVGDAGIAAWTAASITGYTFATLAWKPRLFLSANIASGDNPKSSNLGTFNPLFPRLPYFEEAGFLAPENFKNLQPGLQVKPMEAVLLGIDWNFFWRENNLDAVYVRGLKPLPGTQTAQGSFVANIATLSAQWQVSRNILLEGGYSHFFAGEVILMLVARTAISFIPPLRSHFSEKNVSSKFHSERASAVQPFRSDRRIASSRA